MVYKHAYLNILMLLHSVLMLHVVKMALKGEAGGHALNSHGNYIVDHGKSWKKSWNYVFEFLWEHCIYQYCCIAGIYNFFMLEVNLYESYVHSGIS